MLYLNTVSIFHFFLLLFFRFFFLFVRANLSALVLIIMHTS